MTNNETYFPKTLRIKNEIVELGPKDVKDLYDSKNLIELINKTFSEEYSLYLKIEQYFPGCPFRIYEKTYQQRLDDYKLIYPDSDEFYFLKQEDELFWELNAMDVESKDNFYNFYPHLYSDPHRRNIGFSIKKMHEFIDKRILELGHYFEGPVGVDPVDYASFPRKFFKPARNPNVEEIQELQLSKPDKTLLKNSKLRMYDLENEQGIYFPDDNLFYIDENKTHLVYKIVSRIVMQKKELTEQQIQKLKNMTLVEENPLCTFLYKRFLYAKEIPECDSLTGSDLHINEFEENLLKLQEWVKQITFIYDALAEDPLKRVILMQKAEDLIKWQMQFQTSRAYQDEFSQVLKHLQNEVAKAEKEDTNTHSSFLTNISKLSALETAYLAYYFVEAGEYKLSNNIGALADWTYFSEIAGGANADNIRKCFKEIEHKKNLRLRSSRLPKIQNTLTFIKCKFPEKTTVLEKVEKELEIVQNE